MATIDLQNLSLAELKSLEKDLAKAIADFGNRKKTEAMIALEEHAKALGFSLAELTGKKVRKARTGSGEAKYRHPENPDVTWSGLGRRPAWFTAALEAGNPAESMAV
jgi:DNA-binding protein H-NS